MGLFGKSSQKDPKELVSIAMIAKFQPGLQNFDQ